MKIKEHLDKNNLHHAYLIEGRASEVFPDIIEFIASLGINTTANSDFTRISVDSFKIEDARNLKSFSIEKGFTSSKKIFLISANNFLLEAQHSLLKMFEEPIENTHFFMVIPEINSLLKTLVSRFYLIRNKNEIDTKNAEEFIGMSLQKRINFIKDLLIEPEEKDEEGNEIIALDSSRSKALKFLNALETVLHNKYFRNSSAFFHQNLKNICFEQIFKVREFLRMPGSS